VDDCPVCRSICSCIPDSHTYRITSTKCRRSTVVSPDYGHIVARIHVEIDKYTKNKLCTKLDLFTRLYIYIFIYLFTAIGLLPGGSGYFTCKQNMNLVTTRFKSGGLHDKHVVATWNVGNHLSICL